MLRRTLLTALPIALSFSFLVTLSACASMIFDSVKWNGEQTTKIRKRAAFEMSCPADGLKLTELEHDKDGALKALGVDGCGKKVTFIHVKGWGSDALWAADTASQ